MPAAPLPRHRGVWRGLGALLITALIGWVTLGQVTERIDSFHRCALDGNPTSETDPPVCTTNGLNYLGPRATPGPTQEALIAQSFDLLVSGDSRGTYPARQELIRDQASWQSYWARVHASLPTMPPLLSVDFAQSDVIAVSEGPQHTTGTGIKITGVRTGSTNHISYTTSAADSACSHPSGLVDHYMIIETHKLNGPVVFDGSNTVRPCSQ